MNTAVWVVAIIMAAVVLMRWLDGRRQHRLRTTVDEQLTQQQETIAQLRQRIEVLEALVTDKSFQLRREIDNLPH
ncbi:MAG: hypothetical protein II007_04160 [Gammaproteobacteria bacterium]|nr:hypothetical protein [Gammaproteobacteria bacterium]